MDVGRAIDVEDDAVVVVTGAGGGELCVDRGQLVAALGAAVGTSADQFGVADVAVAADFGGLPLGHGGLGGKAGQSHLAEHHLEGLAFVGGCGDTLQLLGADGRGQRHVSSRSK